MNIEDIIIKIKNDPEKYLGKEISLEKMNYFMNGYLFCLSQNKITLVEGDYWKFNVFLQKKYNMILSLNNENITRFFSENDEEALNKFFELYEEFIKTR